ncbi:DnaB-like helicase C-terminal domain-containing protein [Bacillus sp. FSL M8-0063]|uniref:DnaB-like helicase C-terminal domain-containing protein n=1 Tax=Bacillus sp. FSL M8-0063 TaxID=2921566 RepID=UPI0030F62699
MSRTGEKLLSKIIQTNDPQAIVRYNLRSNHFRTHEEREVLRFIKDYAEKNQNQAPPFDTVVEEILEFNYEPNVGDTYDYLVNDLKGTNAKYGFLQLLQGEASKKFGEMPDSEGIAYGQWLGEKVKNVLDMNSIGGKIGVDAKMDTEDFLYELRRRQQGESFKIWLSKFHDINEAIGGYFTGNMYTFYGRSGRGKSATTLAECVHMAMEGANVLVWALEMAKYEVLVRIYSIVAATKKMFNTKFKGVEYGVGFDTKELLMGTISDEHMAHFENFLKNINDHIAGNLVIRGVDCENFTDRSVKALEKDIINSNADVVLVDPFYYMHTPKNDSGVNGGNFAALSMHLRHLAGRTKVVLMVITQAEETKDENDKDNDTRILRPPHRDEIKKTKQVLEDATNTFGIDTLDGEGVIKLGKGRNGGEGVEVNLLYLAGYGVIAQMPTGTVAAEALKDDW